MPKYRILEPQRDLGIAHELSVVIAQRPYIIFRHSQKNGRSELFCGICGMREQEHTGSQRRHLCQSRRIAATHTTREIIPRRRGYVSRQPHLRFSVPRPKVHVHAIERAKRPEARRRRPGRGGEGWKKGEANPTRASHCVS